MNKESIKLGDKLYYTDNGQYFGEVVKVLKRDVWVKQPDGSIRKGWSKSLAAQMVK